MVVCRWGSLVMGGAFVPVGTTPRRNWITLALAIGLLLVASAPEPASAASAGKPRSFRSTGEFAAGNPFSLRGMGVTRQQFEESCAIPDSQGIDGYVIELPRSLRRVVSDVSLAGTASAGFADLDLYFFDATCTETARASTGSFIEYGTMPAGTRYVLATAFLGADVSFEFEAIPRRS